MLVNVSDKSETTSSVTTASPAGISSAALLTVVVATIEVPASSPVKVITNPETVAETTVALLATKSVATRSIVA